VDSFTRHLPKEFNRRGVQMLTEGKRTFAVMGGEVNHFIPNPTFDAIIEPGCLDLLFRGEIPEGVDPASLMKVDRMANHPDLPFSVTGSAAPPFTRPMKLYADLSLWLARRRTNERLKAHRAG
jgi:hypothetical protein